MSSKNLQKIVIAFGILAVLLIFLGVNFVLQISAVSSSRNSSIASVNQVRANYLDENYARAIVPALTKDNSDYFLRHMTTGIKSKIFTGSDYYERHPSAVVNSEVFWFRFFRAPPSGGLDSLSFRRFRLLRSPSLELLQQFGLV